MLLYQHEHVPWEQDNVISPEVKTYLMHLNHHSNIEVYTMYSAYYT